MDCDGTKAGYDIPLTRAIAQNVSIPVIASGGAGKMEHFKEALTDGMADAALAASLFHYKELEIGQGQGIPAEGRSRGKMAMISNDWLPALKDEFRKTVLCEVIFLKSMLPFGSTPS